MSDPISSLTLPPEVLRRLGYRVVDFLVERAEGLSQAPAARLMDPQQLEALGSQPLPEEGRDPFEVLDRVETEIFAQHLQLDHPRFFAFIPSPSNMVSALADALVAGVNPFVGTWLGAAAPAQIERSVLGWLRDVCEMPESTEGVLVSGGSMANLTALAVARQAVLKGSAIGDEGSRAVIYTSNQTHSSIERAVTTLGFGRNQLRVLAADDRGRLPVASLKAAIAEDRAVGRIPFCVVATAGTTNTGAVDPLPEISEVCRREDLWFHIDGAYGAASAFSSRARSLLPGIDLADSISLDPHKWLFQPFEIGAVLVREGHLLAETFRIRPDYLKDTEVAEGEVNFADRGVQLTRSFRALKLWMSLQVFGRRAFEQAIDHGLDLAEHAQAVIEGLAGWQVMTPASLGIVSFRFAPDGLDGLDDESCDQINAQLVSRMIEDGLAVVSSTRLAGRTALRLCPINPRTTEADVEITLKRLDELARSLA